VLLSKAILQLLQAFYITALDDQMHVVLLREDQ
jgi:hypothetical protein